MKNVVIISIVASVMVGLTLWIDYELNPELKCIDSKIYYKDGDIWIHNTNLYSGSCI